MAGIVYQTSDGLVRHVCTNKGVEYLLSYSEMVKARDKSHIGIECITLTEVVNNEFVETIVIGGFVN